jgi:hypothetical protein
MPVKLIISIAPVFDRRGKPIDGARKLIELGHDPGAVVHLVRTDRPHVVAMKARLGTAAAYTVREGHACSPRFVRWKAPRYGSVRAPMRLTAPAVPQQPKRISEATQRVPEAAP